MHARLLCASFCLSFRRYIEDPSHTPLGVNFSSADKMLDIVYIHTKFSVRSFLTFKSYKGSSQIRLFADDCLIYRPIRSSGDCEALQRDLDSVERSNNNNSSNSSSFILHRKTPKCVIRHFGVFRYSQDRGRFCA